MLNAHMILRIIELQSELALTLAQKLTDTQLQGFVERHEQRLEWLRGLLDRHQTNEAPHE